jgi:hypothetical protein
MSNGRDANLTNSVKCEQTLQQEHWKISTRAEFADLPRVCVFAAYGSTTPVCIYKIIH